MATKTLANNNVVIINEGRLEFLKKFLSERDLYLGLYTQLSPTFNELTALNYERVFIPKYSWIFGDTEFSAYLNFPINFKAYENISGIKGFFIVDGVSRIYTDEFKTVTTGIDLAFEEYLTFYPKIRIY